MILPPSLTSHSPTLSLSLSHSLLQSNSSLPQLSDRVREGTGTWATRAKVASMCRSIPNYCTRPASAGSEGVSHAEYLKLLRSLPFIACPHGGGVDPSPKAWEAILVGTIPIIERSIVVDAYEHLPVVIVDSWEHLFHLNDSAMEYSLTQWITSLKPYYIEGSELRNQTLEVLYHCFCMSDYLWQLLYDLIYCCFYLLTCIPHHVCPSLHVYLNIMSVHHLSMSISD